MSIDNLYSISLVDTLFPKRESFEGEELGRITTLEANSRDRKKSYLESLRLVELFLKILKQSVDAVQSDSFRQFDALVKNFGCQITALELFRLAVAPELKERASRLDLAVKPKLAEVQGRRANFENDLKNSPLSAGRYTFSEVVNYCRLDVEIDELFARLVRFRLLAVINTNVEKEGREVPLSKPDLLRGRNLVPKIDSKVCHFLVNGLQSEESLRAAEFIKGASLNLPPVVKRSRLIVRALADKNRRFSLVKGRSYSPIASLPLLHNTEASLAAIESGLIVVKSKVDFLGKRVAGAVDLRYFFAVERNSLLEEREVKSLSPSLPVVVVEGVVKDGERVKEALAKGRLIDIVAANCALCPQYASATEQSPIDDEEVERDISEIAATAKDVVDKFFDLDHVYCASVGELGTAEEKR